MSHHHKSYCLAALQSVATIGQRSPAPSVAKHMTVPPRDAGPFLKMSIQRTKESEATVPRHSALHNHGHTPRMMQDLRGPIRTSIAPKQQVYNRIRTTLCAPGCISDFYHHIEGSSLRHHSVTFHHIPC